MKKALIVLLILAMAGGLFAQSWSGGVTTGAKFEFGEDGIPVTATDDDSGDAVHASLSFENSGDNWGITVGASAGVGGSGYFDFGDANGWVKFADMFKLTAGKGIGGAWGTGGNTDKDISGSDAGVRLEITPIDGLNFGFRFGYPNGGTSAGKVANFFQETGIGVKYSADAWNAATGLDLDSEESTEVKDDDGVVTKAGELDALWYFGFNYTGIELVKIHFGGIIANLFTDKSVTLYEKFNGSVAGLNWSLEAKETIIPDPLTVALKAALSYPIAISDEASAEVGASAKASYTSDPGFSFDEWNIYAWAKYAFSGTNVWTKAKLDVTGTVGDDSKISPNLIWTIGFSF